MSTAVRALGGRVRRARRSAVGAPRWGRLRRRLLVALLLLVALAAAYQLWFRDSSFVAVQDVRIQGAEGSSGVEARLRAAALEQSTLHVDLGALEAAVADEPAVSAIAAQPDFPHGLTIDVTLREPVGYVKEGGLVIAADGTVLGRNSARPEGLPVFASAGEAEIAHGAVGGEALVMARLVGLAPGPLAELVRGVRFEDQIGLVATISPGLEVRFGDAQQLRAKWAALAAVLADPELTAASYVDVIAPGRPVVGGSGAGGASTTLPETAATPTEPGAQTPAADPAATATTDSTSAAETAATPTETAPDAGGGAVVPGVE
jgi:cell division septal protein FtsQ